MQASIEACGGTVQWFQAAAVRLRVAHWAEGHRGVVILLHGRTEFIEKYLDTVAELQARGLAVWTFDWRGQGASSRHTKDPLAHHVDRFDDYLADLNAIIDRHVRPRLNYRPLLLMGHSMGGHIAARALAKRPELFARAILTAPMIDVIQRNPLPRWLARSIIRLACLIPGNARRYGPGTPRAPGFDRPFDGNPLTTCPTRFDAQLGLLRSTPELAVGGATWGWLRAALASIRILKDPLLLDRIDMPVLVAIAGDDRVVDNRAVRTFTLRLRRGKMVVIEGARHELLREQDRYRHLLWAAIDQFLEPL